MVVGFNEMVTEEYRAEQLRPVALSFLATFFGPGKSRC
jgi:hypothetical protein